MKPRPIFAVGAFFVLSLASAAMLSTPLQQTTTPAPSLSPTPISVPANITSKDIQTFDCEYPEYKPETIMLTCGDGGWYVHKIVWHTWTKNGATGTGIFSQNLCDPSCAEGRFVEEAVNVRLSDIDRWKGKYYFRTLEISTTSGKDFTWGRAGNFYWDVMEFAEYMDS